MRYRTPGLGCNLYPQLAARRADRQRGHERPGTVDRLQHHHAAGRNRDHDLRAGTYPRGGDAPPDGGSVDEPDHYSLHVGREKIFLGSKPTHPRAGATGRDHRALWRGGRRLLRDRHREVHPLLHHPHVAYPTGYLLDRHLMAGHGPLYRAFIEWTRPQIPENGGERAVCRPTYRCGRFYDRTMVWRDATLGLSEQFLVWAPRIRVRGLGSLLANTPGGWPLLMVMADDASHRAHYQKGNFRTGNADSLLALLCCHRAFLRRGADVGQDHQLGHRRILALVGSALLGGRVL